VEGLPFLLSPENEEYMKKQSKGVPTNRDIRWDRLDNTAHLFPGCGIS